MTLLLSTVQLIVLRLKVSNMAKVLSAIEKYTVLIKNIKGNLLR